MIVKSLELMDYRNYSDLYIQFHNHTNILYGNNAQGKTNVLEAIYLCATTKSHRGSKDKEIINFNKDESHIRTIVLKNDVEYKLDMHLKKNKTKGVAINEIPIRKSSDLFGIINIVFFSPEDLSIIKNGPSERRRFIDFELCQLDKVYLYNLSNYNKILNQRNNLLKQLIYNSKLMDTLPIWNDQLVNYGKKVISSRSRFVNMINNIISDIHSNLTGNSEKIVVKYEPNVDEYSFMDMLEHKKDSDLKYLSTQVGPHRDDISFLINNIDIRKYGSQGQQRTAALSLKLAEIQLVKLIIKDNPILLLDDVMSELDNNRKNYLLESIKDTQTIITCTGLDEFINSRLNIDKIFEVNNGQISSMKRI